jgi:hypothetical protein
MRPCLYSPFKGEKEGLLIAKMYWNFIQSSTQITMEKAFGIQWKGLLEFNGKGFWNFEGNVKDPIEKTKCAIMKYITCGYSLHLSS